MDKHRQALKRQRLQNKDKFLFIIDLPKQRNPLVKIVMTKPVKKHKDRKKLDKQQHKLDD